MSEFSTFITAPNPLAVHAMKARRVDRGTVGETSSFGSKHAAEAEACHNCALCHIVGQVLFLVGYVDKWNNPCCFASLRFRGGKVGNVHGERADMKSRELHRSRSIQQLFN